jgi:hypothetical protein
MTVGTNWEPGFGEIYTWFAVDRNGRVAVMVNNCYGDLPRVLLRLDSFDYLLDSVSEYLWEESEGFELYPKGKCGDFILDCYSFWRYGEENKGALRNRLVADLTVSQKNSEVNFPVNKGLFLYHAVEGSFSGEDYPVGYDGDTGMGDYFRYLIPTKIATIDEIPVSLRKGFVRSADLDFMSDRLIENSKVNEYFKELLES